MIPSPGLFVVQAISWLQERNHILFSPIKGDSDRRCASWPMTCNVPPASDARQRSSPWSSPWWTGVLTCAVVRPAQRPASSLMEVWGVMFRALTRVNPLFIIYHSHTPAGRGAGGNRPRPDETLLTSFRVNSLLGGWHATGRCARCQTLTMRLDDQLHEPLRCDRMGVPA